MAMELVFTSASDGASAGASGFCTVLHTENLSKVLMNRLESLSVYHHLFTPAPDPRNPIAWSHLVLRTGTSSYNVVSRISDYHLDYSGRTNFLAHHIVLDNVERPVGGPAWLVDQVGFMFSSWDGKSRVVSQKAVPRGDRSPALCKAWKEAAGDPGWGGVLADLFVEDAQRTAYVIYDPSRPVLPLVIEALSLVPPEMRWQVTFSTFYGKHLAAFGCNWRFTPAGSADAADAIRVRDAKVIDLTRPLGVVPRTDRTQRASGVAMPVVRPQTAEQFTRERAVPLKGDSENESNAREPARERRVVAPPREAIATAPQGTASAVPPPPRALNMDDVELIRAERKHVALMSGPQPLRTVASSSFDYTSESIRRPSRLKVIAPIAVFACAAVGAIVALMPFGKNGEPTPSPQDDSEQQTSGESTTDKDKSRGNSQRRELPKVPEVRPDQIAEPPREDSTKHTKVAPESVAAPDPLTKQSDSSTVPLKSKPDEPKANAKTSSNDIEVTASYALPALEGRNSPVSKALGEVVPELASQNINGLRVWGLQDVVVQMANEKDRSLAILFQGKDAEQAVPIGRFQQKKDLLEFQWEKNAPDTIVEQLKWCILEIRGANNQQYFVKLNDLKEASNVRHAEFATTTDPGTHYLHGKCSDFESLRIPISLLSAIRLRKAQVILQGFGQAPPTDKSFVVSSTMKSESGFLVEYDIEHLDPILGKRPRLKLQASSADTSIIGLEIWSERSDELDFYNAREINKKIPKKGILVADFTPEEVELISAEMQCRELLEQRAYLDIKPKVKGRMDKVKSILQTKRIQQIATMQITRLPLLKSRFQAEVVVEMKAGPLTLWYPVCTYR